MIPRFELLTQTVEKWDGATPPSDELNGLASSIVFTLKKDWDEFKNQLESPSSALGQQQHDLEELPEFRMRRRDAYSGALTVVKTLRDCDETELFTSDPKKQNARVAYSNFWRFYYGHLLLVEEHDVETKMVELGELLALAKPEGEVPWTKSRKRPRSFVEIADQLVEFFESRVDE